MIVKPRQVDLLCEDPPESLIQRPSSGARIDVAFETVAVSQVAAVLEDQGASAAAFVSIDRAEEFHVYVESRMSALRK